jgi:hypothetical protein
VGSLGPLKLCIAYWAPRFTILEGARLVTLYHRFAISFAGRLRDRTANDWRSISYARLHWLRECRKGVLSLVRVRIGHSTRLQPMPERAFATPGLVGQHCANFVCRGLVDASHPFTCKHRRWSLEAPHSEPPHRAGIRSRPTPKYVR